MSNEYYDHLAAPQTGSQLSSAVIRAEFAKIEQGFDKLPNPSGSANKLLVVNPSGTAVTATDEPDINGGTIDNAQIGSVIPSTATFTTMNATSAATAPTRPADDDTNHVATTAFVLGQGSDAVPNMDGSPSAGTSEKYARSDHVHPTDTSRAPLASPALTGVPTAPTAAIGTDTTQIATTAFVNSEINNDRPFESTAGNILMNGVQSLGVRNTVARGDHVHPTDTTRAPLASPTFTGTVTVPTLAVTAAATAPTLAVDTSTTGVATTAFVLGQAATSTPLVNGTAAIGTSLRYARQDHVHATDPTRAPLNNPVFTGTVTLPGAPTANLHAATKEYVDGVATGLDSKQACRAATTENITLSGLQTIDGVTLVADDRVLVKNQTTLSQNGIYVASSSGWTRATDADGVGEIRQGTYVFVNEGTTQAKTGWTQQTSGTITVGTSPIVWNQFSSAQLYTAGTGLSLTGNTFNVSTVPAANGGTGQTSYSVGDILYASGATALSKLAGVATGNALISGGVGAAPSWGKVGLTTHVSGTLAVGNGGTGATTFTSGGLLRGNGTSAVSVASAGDIVAAIGATAVQNATSATNATTSTNLASGVAGAVPYQSGAGATGFSAAGTSGQVLTSGGTGAPTWTSQSALSAGSATNATNVAVTNDTTTNATHYVHIGDATSGNDGVKVSSTKLTFNPSTGMLTATGFTGPLTGNASTATTATTATNLAAGAAGRIPYQSGAGATAFSAAGTTGQALLSGGTGAPTWGTVGVSTGGTGATTAADARTNLGVPATDGTGASGTWGINITGSANSATTATTAGNVTGTVAVANGGTGATTLSGVVIGNGTSAFTAKTNPAGAFVGTTDTQTLTNKTLTSPRIGTSLLDTNGNQLFNFTATASAVNELTYANAAAGGSPTFTASGSDTNISINLVPKGTGTLRANNVDVVTVSGTQTLTNKTIAGTQISGNISGSAGNVTGTVAVANGGTGSTTAAGARTNLGAAATNQTMHVGTTALAINRASAAQTLTGVSIDGNAATVTNGVYTTGNQTIGGTKTFSSTISGSITGNAGTVTNGVYTTGDQTIGGNKTFNGLYSSGQMNFSAGVASYMEFVNRSAGALGYRFYTGANGTGITFTLDSNGDATATGNVTAFSDIRLKTDLTKITDALWKVQQLSGYTYTRIDTGERQTGVVAQEVQAVLPEAVIDNGETLAVAYGNMVGLLIEAAKELTARVEKLEGR